MFNENTWKSGEKLALDYLKKNGYKIKYTNYSCAGVELDIVAIFSKRLQQKKLKEELKQKLQSSNNKIYADSIKKAYKNLSKDVKDILVIVEVKSRANEKYGLGADAISVSKKRNIIKGAKYLLKDYKFQDTQFRFDVISVDSDKVIHIEDAFSLN